MKEHPIDDPTDIIFLNQHSSKNTALKTRKDKKTEI